VSKYTMHCYECGEDYTEAYNWHRCHIEQLHARYPVETDPRRDPDFGTRSEAWQNGALLGAILDTLNRIERAAVMTSGGAS
jgi:hypothetical protein